MPAGFGAKKKVVNISDIRCEYEARELTDEIESKATQIVNRSNKWEWWDYYSDFEFQKANAKKAPEYIIPISV